MAREDMTRNANMPARVRLALISVFVLLLLAAIAGILWRGPAILLDLAGYAQALWCF